MFDRCGALLGAALLAATARLAADDYTAVNARTSNDYERVQSMDHRYTPETYALGVGGDYSGPERDKESERVGFREVMDAIAKPLADQDYVPTKDPNKTKLLIMVYWGTTTGTGDFVSENNFTPDPNPDGPKSAAVPGSPPSPFQVTLTTGGFNFEQDSADASSVHNRGVSDGRNASILGYDTGLAIPAGSEITALHVTRDDLIDDVRHNRYFVVLMAYDFQKLWKEKKHKLIWETRFSVRQRDGEFLKILPSMALYASQFFGKDTYGLIRRPLPEGRVEVGEAHAVALNPETGASSQVAAMIEGPSAREAEAQKWMNSSVPPALERRIEAYKRDRAALMQDLAARLKEGSGGGAVDAFDADNATRIAMLSRTAQGIRGDLAQIAANRPQQTSDQPVNSLVKQFNAEIREMDVTEPILTHP